MCVCVCGDFVWTSHILTTQEPSNLNYSRHVFVLLDACLISIMQQRSPDKHVSYDRVGNVRSKLRKFKSRNAEFFSCRGLDVVYSEPLEVNILCGFECILCSLSVYKVARVTVVYFGDSVQGCIRQSTILGNKNGSWRCEFFYGQLQILSAVKLRV